MYIVEELCLGAKERNSGVERRGPGTTSGAWSRDASESAPAPKPVAVSSFHLGHTRSRHWARRVPRLPLRTISSRHRRCWRKQPQSSERQTDGWQIWRVKARAARELPSCSSSHTKQVKDLVNKRFGAFSKGTITDGQIDKDTLIDTHYGAIAANAMERGLGI